MLNRHLTDIRKRPFNIEKVKKFIKENMNTN